MKVKENGHEVYTSHITSEECYLTFDFFDWDKKSVKNFDYIISNPPYSIRKQVFQHLEELELPFAMLIPLVSIALKDIKNKIEDKQLLIFDKRIKFKSSDNIICKNPPSETAYICKGVLDKQIVYKILGEVE